jgi:hypothetical protein
MRGCVKMKKLVKSLLVVSASLVAANSAVASMIDDFCPYVGIDYKQRWMKERHFASNNSNRNASLYGGTIYVGSRWDCFGLEAGLEFAGRNRRTITFNNGATASVRASLWGGYLDALAFAPVADCLEVFGGFGVGVLSPRVNYTINTGTFAGISGSTGSKAAAVARLRLGLNYMVSDCVGLRGAIGWESTENLAIRSGDFSRYHPFANSFTLQAGIFAKF